MKRHTLNKEFVIFQREPVRQLERQAIDDRNRVRGARGGNPKKYGQRRKQYANAVRALVNNMLLADDEEGGGYA
jgi:hypothetical protein